MSPWIAASVVLLIVMGLLLPFPIERLGGPASVSYNEGWNAYREAQAAAGQPLYGAPPSLNVTNYPPIWFHVVGVAPHLGLGFNYAGRLLSLVSIVLLGLLACGISRSLALSWPASVFSALFFATSLILYSLDRIGMNDPQLFGMLFSAAGLLAYLRAGDRASWLLLSAACFALGVFTKNNLLAFPLAVGLHMLLRRQIRALGLWCLAGAVLSGLFLFVTWYWDGRFFLQHLLRPRAMVPMNGLLESGTYCLKFAAPLMLAILWACRQKLRSPGGLLVLALAVTHLVAVGFACGDGVARNIFFEALFITSIALSAAIDERSTGSPAGGSLASGGLASGGLALAGWLLVALSSVFVQIPGALGHDARVVAQLAARENDFAKLIRIVGEQRGPVLCEDLLLCFDAHQPSGFDAYYVHDQILAGKIDEAEILAMLRRQEFSMIVIGSPEMGVPITSEQRRRFSVSFMRTLLAMYRPGVMQSGYTVLVPRRTPA